MIYTVTDLINSDSDRTEICSIIQSTGTAVCALLYMALPPDGDTSGKSEKENANFLISLKKKVKLSKIL